MILHHFIMNCTSTIQPGFTFQPFHDQPTHRTLDPPTPTNVCMVLRIYSVDRSATRRGGFVFFSFQKSNTISYMLNLKSSFFRCIYVFTGCGDGRTTSVKA